VGEEPSSVYVSEISRQHCSDVGVGAGLRLTLDPHAHSPRQKTF
jgi:hypothetical protein